MKLVRGFECEFNLTLRFQMSNWQSFEIHFELSTLFHAQSPQIRANLPFKISKMGVVTVHQYPIVEGRSGQQMVEGLIKTLELLGAKKVGTFLVDCETYYSAPNISPARVLNIIHNSDQPATCFALLDSGSCISVDTNFDLLMLTMSSLYQSKKSSKMECKGPKMQLADFSIKIGMVTIGPSFKGKSACCHFYWHPFHTLFSFWSGILIEVEYGPCSVANYCWAMMREFMSNFLTGPVEPHSYLQNRMNELFTPMDTTQQYNDQFNSLRKASTTSSTTSQSNVSGSLSNVSNIASNNPTTAGNTVQTSNTMQSSQKAGTWLWRLSKEYSDFVHFKKQKACRLKWKDGVSVDRIGHTHT